ncbi:ABC-type multidrug transport system ATPase subunit [Isoptericola sp. CG 20/1183]|uniref:ABC-type multidrug transport system ATPase subunit n=1 Tax=Isoptericola halotolerans TaxID=300560 RepID=A0ABX5EG11_9MICO|nr:MULTISPECIES: ABC transporter ATP-binding protein [Isoptericola]MCK0116938.1 ABC transporter ATP-binding protein [Isoptericola sp. S6320L]PRZ08288.1 ABC-type multidrug transport system ATPase subunit [Isoptericola halotolerans]PRZ09085.1 ABC-type multidrug transport system ATPase subunit [Isoptericola sp. CG 20/1183]
MTDDGGGISTRGVRRAFGAVHAVVDVELEARPGRVTALVGPNGSGKTTLLLMLAGLLAPDAGEIRVAGVDPAAHGRAARARIGWMPDVFGTWESLTAREVLVTVAAAYRMTPDDGARRAAELLELVHLTELADSPAHVLSRGQKQRLGLARALVHDPDVLLLDEPASGLDPRSRVDLRELVRRLAAAGKTILISSHVLTELDEMADDAVFISQGRTVRSQSVDDAAAERRAWRIAALSPGLLTDWLTTAGTEARLEDDGTALVELDGDEAAAALLRDAVSAGVPVVSLAPAGGALEQAYLRLEEERR